jgi:hypothetical protein
LGIDFQWGHKELTALTRSSFFCARALRYLTRVGAACLVLFVNCYYFGITAMPVDYRLFAEIY